MVDGIKQYLNSPKWRQQHRWRKAVYDAMARLGLTGVHALPISRRWIDIERISMPLNNLDAAFVGMKIIQISDLHYSPMVWRRYLVQFVRWINELKPDLVVVTGDLITGGYPFAERVGAILSHIQAPQGVICTFGNHDYSIHGKSNVEESHRRGNHLEKCLKRHGLIVLRNQAHPVRVDGCERPLLIVGLDDEWSGHIDPETAWRGVDETQPIICLNHNPVNVQQLLKWPWQWMLSGHTHGRQVATSKFGKRFYGHRYRHYTKGQYAIGGRQLYVNRGLSYGQRIHDWCRPEVTVFRLTQAEKEQAPEILVERTETLTVT